MKEFTRLALFEKNSKVRSTAKKKINSLQIFRTCLFYPKKETIINSDSFCFLQDFI